jgi:hypothetical protein
MGDKGGTTARKPQGVGRRRLLAGAGASGLAAAMAVFGRGTPAFAANWHCCNLVHNPPNMSFSSCTTTSGSYDHYYNWYCTERYLRCQCCEHYINGVSTPNGSAGKCS